MKIRSISLSLLFLFHFANGRQGMWQPTLLEKLNAEEMRKLGLEIPVSSIFTDDSTGFNAAVVQFGGGCTGEVVSDSGLIFTNHHCGFSQVQALSSLEHNYLKDGYWASSRQQELPCPGLTVTFVRDIRDVTSSFKSRGIDTLNETAREKMVKFLSDSLEKANSQGTRFNTLVRPFFGGNQYQLFITEVYRDVRLVGTPPSYIGNFGEETDNWRWPRHTGDFMVFRIYAGADNRPADFSTSNRPYVPGRSLRIHAGGMTEGAFTFVYGFPGRTQQFLPSSSLKLIVNQTNPVRISLRDIRMDIWNQRMSENDTIRLKYAGKFRSLANSYKKWKGELEGLDRADAIASKCSYEEKFTAWAASGHPDYAGLVTSLNGCVDSSASISLANDYFTEGLNGIELIAMASRLRPVMEAYRSTPDDNAKLKSLADKVRTDLEGLYRNYDASVDRAAATRILEVCDMHLEKDMRPAFLDQYHQNKQKYIKKLFESAFLADKDRLFNLFEKPDQASFKKLSKDPAWIAADELYNTRTKKLEPELNAFNERINRMMRRYIAGQLELNDSNPVAPDANSTLRVSYGKVESMSPADGTRYDWYTTSDGIIEKWNSGQEDYAADSSFIDLLKEKEFGRYASDGKLHTAFIASNHTTGGNSGSPVMDSKGRLIGINFDRIWEGVMSDLYFDGRLSRNIAVDIRYVLYVIDRVGNAKWLFDEMKVDW
ncbi:MAG: S46 family peptidase [Bacteroidota bacterium]